MSENLFEIPESRPSRLAELRKNYDAAVEAYEEARACYDDERGPKLADALDDVRRLLEAEEAEELNRNRRTP